ncbi:hypothetical protein JL721_6749 [Aureococcus anophagefferens]|nr:hypothetical protein JL721_6749 [Aureococcus anophagefferens]
MAAKAIADAIRTSLGPRGMDKMIQKGDGEVDAVATCLSSKVIAQNSARSRRFAVDAVLESSARAATVDLDRVKIVKQVGGTVDDTELVDGIVFAQGAKKAAGGRRRRHEATFPAPTRVANAKIGLIQFCLSAPKTDMENSVVVSDYAAMDRLLREGGSTLCKKVKKAGVTVLLIQKSILRDAYNDLSLHFLAKMGILVVADVAPRAAFDRRSGRSRPRFGTLELGRIEVAHVDSLEAATLGAADLVHEVSMPGSSQKVVKVTGVARRSLRKRHRGGEADAGIDVKRGAIGRMRARAVVQPLLVNTSALGLATECICMILKIDDLVLVR